MKNSRDEALAIGDFAARAGITVATARYYEELGLIASVRTSGNQRRFRRYNLRRVAFVVASQRVGLSLDEVADALATLPDDRAPTRRDWTRLSQPWRRRIDQKIRELEALRDNLDGCIGCGCLSLARCSLFNPRDEAAHEGAGSRWLREL